jgi:opacity protein-like surface antigen
MKKSLLVAAAATVALMASAAQAQVAGHVGVNYARTNVDVAGPNPDLDSYQLESAVAFNLGQFGAVIDGAVTDVGGDVDDLVDYAFTGHLNGKVGGALVGGFGGVFATKNLTVWSAGVEGQAALAPNVTLYGQAGYGNSDDLDGANLWALRGEVRYFVNDNVKLQGQAGWNKVDTDHLGSYDTWTVGVEGEYQFAGTPWSVLAGYDYSDSSDLDVKTSTFRVGGRYTFGGATLKARDASGADLGSVRKLFTGVTGF